MGLHAFMSPSSAHITLHCPLSAILSFRIEQRIELYRQVGVEFFGLQDDPDADGRINAILKEDNVMANEGTAFHSVFEKVVPMKKLSKKVIMNLINSEPDIQDSTRKDLYVIERFIKVVLYERKLLKTLEWYELEKKCKIKGLPQFGTTDVVGFKDRALFIRDLKTGRNEVSAKENWQLMTYAVGVLDEFGWDKFDKIHIGIIGTRFASSNWMTTPEHLLDFKRNVMLPAFMNAYSLNPRVVAGKHCQYCIGKIGCKVWQDKFNGIANETFDNLDIKDNTNDELVALYSLCKQAETLCKSELGPEIMLQFESFDNPPKGITRVSTGKIQKWTKDEKSTVKELSKLVSNKHQLYSEKLLTPKNMSVLLGDKIPDDLIQSVQKKPYLQL